jgi:type IV fimbrial biogenesis protein FimT
MAQSVPISVVTMRPMLSSASHSCPSIASREGRRHTPPLPTHVHGVTLIELMVTLVVLAIVLAIGAPALNTFVERQAVEGAAEQFAGDIRYARTEAMKRGQAVSICIRSETVANGVTTVACAAEPGDDGFATGWLVFADVSADGALDTAAGDTLLRDQQAISRLVTSMLAETANRVAYTVQSTGIMLGAADRITILPGSGAAQQRLLCMNMIGRARVTAIGAQNCGN